MSKPGLWAIVNAGRYRRGGIGSGSPGGGEGEDGVDGGFEGAGVALDLDEEQAALERGEQCYGEVVGTDVGREVPGGLESPQPVADGGRPPREAVGDKGAGRGVGLCELAA
jgi:hypothetical protein